MRGYAAFFPAHLRYPILQAGADITLLEIVYDGIKRIVEPYSLVYKVRKDGVGSEYFYVYDRTGGRYSGPGIKTFLHPKIESINNLDENFEPRYEIELSKAGEPSKKSYFGQPFSISKLGFKKSRISKRGISSTHTGPIYIYECIICGKTFRRKKSSTKLNKHKDEYGNRCYGKTGILRETIY